MNSANPYEYFCSIADRVIFYHMEASEPKWVNYILNIIIVNSLIGLETSIYPPI